MSLHPDAQTFADLLHEIEALLSEHGKTHWAAQIALCLKSVERSEAYGLHRFLSFFGSMGSLNDVMLSCDAEDARLHALLSQAWEVGNRLARDESK